MFLSGRGGGGNILLAGGITFCWMGGIKFCCLGGGGDKTFLAGG